MSEISVFTYSNYMTSEPGVCDEVILTVECYLDGKDYDDPIVGDIVSVFNKTTGVEIDLNDIHPNDLIQFQKDVDDEIENRSSDLIADWMSAAADAAYERIREDGWE